MTLSSRAVIWIVGILSVIAVVISFTHTQQRIASLSLPQDYQYFYGVVVRALHPDYIQSIPVQTIGKNIFFVGGSDSIEAKKSIYQSIHFEPIKYGLIFLYSAIPYREMLFLFYAILFFTPLIYFAYGASRKVSGEIVLLLALLYILFPSALIISAENIRPYNLFAPFMLMAYTAFLFSRPQWERVTAFTALLLVREEGLFFALPLLGIVCLETYREKIHIWRRLRSYAIVWGIGALATVSYFLWAGYLFAPKEYPSLMATLSPVIFLTIGVIGVSAVVFFAMKRNMIFSGIVFLYILPFFIFFHRMITDVEFAGGLVIVIKNIIFTFIFGRYYMPVLAVAICLLAFCISILSTTARQRRIVVGVLIFVIAGSMAINLFANHGFYKEYIATRSRVDNASVVWEAHKHAQASFPDGVVITDTITMNAFVDYNKAYDYSLLPYDMSGERIGYPENSKELHELIQLAHMIVVSEMSVPQIRDIITTSGISTELFSQNDDYRVYKIIQ